MNLDETADTRLGRISSLLAELPGPLGNGEMLVWIERTDRDAMPQAVFDHLRAAGLHDRWYPQIPVNVPETATEMMNWLGEIDQQAAADLFVGLTTRTLAYNARGRYDEPKAREVFSALRRLLDDETTWWTNAFETGRDPVTRHIFDAMVIAAGTEMTVVLLVFDED